MASAAVDIKMEECPICTEEYRDARVLECGHHFCKVCLEEIATGHPGGHVTCPTCRHITNTAGKDDISILPKYRIVNDFVGLVNSAVLKKEEAYLCQICQENPEKAVKVCFGCPALLCNLCATKHSQVLTKGNRHAVYNVSPHILCEKHRELSRHFNIMFCASCKELCCANSAFNDHNSHEIEPVELEAARIKSEIRDAIEIMQYSSSDEKLGDKVNNILEEARKAKKDFNASVKSIRSGIEEMLTKLAAVETETNVNLDSEIKHLEMMARDLRDLNDSKQKLVSHLEYLEKNAADQEIINIFPDLPKYDPKFYRKLISKNHIQIPHISNIGQNLQDCQKALQVHYKQHSLYMDEDFLKSLHTSKKESFEVGPEVSAMVIDEKRRRLIIRRKDVKAPISVYDYHGNRLQIMGKEVTDVCYINFQGLCMDKFRDLYIFPVHGDLVCMTLEGNINRTIKSNISEIHSVCHTMNDKYVCSSVGGSFGGTKHLYLADPSQDKPTLNVLYKNLQGAWNITSSATSCFGSGGQPIIIVSEMWIPCLKGINIKGEVMFTLGTTIPGLTPNVLNSPWGLCADPYGGILLCDRDNKRVLHVQENDKVSLWKEILGSAEFDFNPRFIAYDTTVRSLFIAPKEGKILVCKW